MDRGVGTVSRARVTIRVVIARDSSQNRQGQGKMSFTDLDLSVSTQLGPADLTSSVEVQSEVQSLYLKVLSPSNKKDFTMYTLREVIADELLTVEDLKQEIYAQCGEEANLPHTLQFKVGYFHRSKKLWINNEHDLNDAVTIIRNNERLTLWALSASPEVNKKRRRSDDADDVDNDLTG